MILNIYQDKTYWKWTLRLCGLASQNSRKGAEAQRTEGIKY